MRKSPRKIIKRLNLRGLVGKREGRVKEGREKECCHHHRGHKKEAAALFLSELRWPTEFDVQF
jgi:hypothetical protein